MDLESLALLFGRDGETDTSRLFYMYRCNTAVTAFSRFGQCRLLLSASER